MKRFFTLALFASLSFVAKAQFPLESPFPGEFRVISPTAISGTYDVGRQTAGTTTDYWGDTLTQTVCGELAWGFGPGEVAGVMQPDTFGCGPMTNDLTGKIALIRRGGCNFSLKVYHAQQAGAVGAIVLNHYTTAADGPATISNMLGGDSLAVTHIPAVFFNRETAEAVLAVHDAGNAVNACFYVPNFASPNAGYGSAVPFDETVILEDVGASYFNLTQEEVTIMAKCTVIDPNGAEEVLTKEFTVMPAQDTVYTHEDNYELASGEGVYTFVYTTEGSLDTLTRTMEVSESLFSLDNGVIDDYSSTDSTRFAQAGLKFDVGNTYFTGTSQRMAVAATFAIQNIEEFVDDKFTVVLYDLDADGNGALPVGAAFDYTTNVTEISPIAYEDVVVTDTMNNDELITVTFDAVELKDTSVYLLMIRYDGNESGSGKIPHYSVAGRDVYRTISGMVYTSNGDGTAPQLFTGGFSNDEKAVARLHMEPPVGVKDILPLDPNKFSAYPTPATDYLNVDLKLASVNESVVIRLTGLDGKLANEFNLSNVQNGNYRFDVRNVASGHYLLTVMSNEGVRTQKVQVAH